MIDDNLIMIDMFFVFFRSVGSLTTARDKGCLSTDLKKNLSVFMMLFKEDGRI